MANLSGVLLGLLRVLWWFGWVFFFRTILWSIGWVVLRILSLGRYPDVSIGDDDGVEWWEFILIALLGHLVLISAIGLITGWWPSLRELRRLVF